MSMSCILATLDGEYCTYHNDICCPNNCSLYKRELMELEVLGKLQSDKEGGKRTIGRCIRNSRI